MTQSFGVAIGPGCLGSVEIERARQDGAVLWHAVLCYAISSTTVLFHCSLTLLMGILKKKVQE